MVNGKMANSANPARATTTGLSPAASMISAQKTNMSKAEMLKKARELWTDKKQEHNTHKIEKLNDQTICYDDDALPEKAILHFQSNTGCDFSLAQGTSIVKLLVESCRNCTITLPSETKLVTSTVEMWDCDNVTFNTQIEIGTLQLDVSKQITVGFGKTEHLGQLVQAGVEVLNVSFLDRPDFDFLSGTAHIRKTICPDMDSLDRTTQFISRNVDGQILTEEIIRLANDFPTTLREKEKHDAQIRKKDAFMSDMAQRMVSGPVADTLGEKETRNIKKKVNIAKKKADAELNQDVGENARAEYRRKMGNEQFKIQEYQQAAVHYTEALDLDPSIAAVWANRAMCWLKLANPDRALADADKCLALDANYTKAHFRRGVALLELERYVDACLAFRRTLDLDPKNAQARSSIMLAEKKMSLLDR